MRVILSSSFLQSITSLEPSRMALAQSTALSLQRNPADAALQFHRIIGAKDKRFWLLMASPTLSIVIHLTPNALTLSYAAAPDLALAWARQHRLEEHPTTGALQLLTHDNLSYTPRDTNLFASYSTASLLELGVPVAHVDWVKGASQQEILQNNQALPEEVIERLLLLASGSSVPIPKPTDHTLTNPDTQRRFIEANTDEFALALSSPWERWLVFLHPSQRSVIEKNFAGPAKIIGSAGTGKTVAALHRAAFLARQHPSHRILLTTYTRALTSRLSYLADLLLGKDSPARQQIVVSHLHSVAAELYRKHTGKRFQELTRDALQDLLQQGIQRSDETGFSQGFLLAEWEAVIEPLHIRDWTTYRNAPRSGRGKALGASQKRLLWNVFEWVLSETGDKISWGSLCHTVTALLDTQTQPPFDHIIADEGQDFSPGELRLLRRLVAPAENDLFLCADPGQRIYRGSRVWKDAGIDTTQRVHRLSVNYRTTAEIGTFSNAIVQAGDDEEEKRQSIALFSGLPPAVHPFASIAEESQALQAWVNACVLDGYRPGEIAIFARTRSIIEQRAAKSLTTPFAYLNEQDGTNPEKISLGTMHLAKGLEFKAVAIIGCEEKYIPLASALQSLVDEGDRQSTLEQERNLFYVACSRARERLWLSYSGTPSTFLPTLPAPTAPTPQTSQGTTKAPFKLSPSRVARYFQLGCERYLRFDATQHEARAIADGVPPRVEDENPLLNAVRQEGFQWEETVLRQYIDGHYLMPPGESPGSTKRFSHQETLEHLRRGVPGQYIYQATLVAPPNFYEKYRLDSSLVAISDNHPDLIAILQDGEGRRLFRIFDMKRGSEMRSAYQVQILFYALELACILERENIQDARVDLEQGAVWLGGQPKETLFSMAPLRSHVERFLEEELTQILQKHPRDVFWHLHFRCEKCRFFAHCQADMRAHDDLSRISSLSSQGKRHLRNHDITTTKSLKQFLIEDPTADQYLKQCASLVGQRPQLQKQASSLQEDKVILHGSSTPGLPKPSPKEVSLFITLHLEPIGHSVFVAGYHLEPGKGVLPKLLVRDNQSLTRVFVAPTQEQTANLRRQFIYELHAFLLRLDAYNLQRASTEQVSLQVYVLSSQEKELLLDLLLESLRDPELSEPAMTLLLYFQGPDLILSAEHPADQLPYPVVVLLTALGRLLALPVEVSYTLPEALAKLGSPYQYPRDEEFHYPLGPGLRADAAYALWHLHKPENQLRIRQQAERHLQAISALHSAIREKAASQLFSKALRFQLPATTHIQNPLISRLAFFTDYEALLRYMKVRETRMASPDELHYAESVWPMEAIDSTHFRLITDDPSEMKKGGWGDYLLVRDTPEGRMAQLQYKDYHHRADPRDGAPSELVAVVSVPEPRKGAVPTPGIVEVRYERFFAKRGAAPGERFLLYQRFNDMITQNLTNFLLRLDQQSPGLFLLLLTQPQALSIRPFASEVEGFVQQHLASLGLTTSQREAYDAVRREPVTALWGPPGTGKTHFLASIILGLAEAHYQANKPFRVLLTAFTHAAIENLMLKICSLLAEKKGWDIPLKIAKAKDWKNKDKKPAKVTVPKSGLVDWFHEKPYAIFGATVWASLKLTDLEGGFDLVVVDEASQMKVPEAAIPTSLVSPEGRIIFAGDHFQLPPIVSGTYKAPPAGEIALHRSIFEAALTLQNERFKRQLQENFRMNETLTSVAARLLYSAKYRCGTDKVAQRSLHLEGQPSKEAIIHSCLEPSASLVLVVLKGLIAGKENLTEAKLVSRLVVALREQLRYEDGKPFTDEKDFFAHGVFVVSPHHSQIHLIRQELAQQGILAPFVDTVDKMQGQEAEAVLVSYGVSDPEFAQKEAEFIYSLNRLNVSLTRAKSKMIVCLSEQLLNALPEVLENETAAEGLGFMRGLAELLDSHGDTSCFILEDGTIAEVRRLQQPVPVALGASQPGDTTI